MDETSITVQYAQVTQELSQAIETVSRVSIALAPIGADRGLDGTSYELAVTEGVSSVCLRWWERLPEAWAALAEPLSNLRTHLGRVEFKPGS